ncbi:MAG: hypothetical protein JW910_01960, partial [Anaerolineae bacterium]|nr:hypothetical protein [Anaerolineae bacterium]
DAMLMTEGYQMWLMDSDPLAVFSLLGEALFVETDALYAAPDIIQTELMFPYIAGRDFAYTLFVAGDGWPLVNAAYDAPPISTEHVLHPERYVGGEAPLAVGVAPVGDLLGDEYRLVWDRTLGEFYLREHLRLLLPNEIADPAAAGWGGDRYLLYFNDDIDTTVLVWRLAWDTEADAQEFAATYRGYNALRFAGPGESWGETTCWPGDLETLCLRAGTVETLVIVAPEATMLPDLIASQAPPR